MRVLDITDNDIFQIKHIKKQDEVRKIRRGVYFCLRKLLDLIQI